MLDQSGSEWPLNLETSVRPICLIATLTMLSAATALAQEAYVYDSLPYGGIFAYAAASDGKLTLIEGSPFNVNGQSMIGTNGSYIVTADIANLYSYAVEPNGAVGKQISRIVPEKYDGGECGILPNPGQYPGGIAEFDHTGENIYLHLTGAAGQQYPDGACDAIQTYGISKSGVLTFKGNTYLNVNSSALFTADLPTLTGNGKVGFGFEYNEENGDLCNGTTLNVFTVDSGGVVDYNPNVEPFPPAAPAPPSGSTWLLQAKTDDPADHIVLAMNSTSDPDCEDSPTFGPTKLVSYTADSQGHLATTNTYKDAPSLPGEDSTFLMKLDPTGKILAVATGTGVAFYRFNGTSPLTPITGIIGTSGAITLMNWDDDDHLYAQNEESGRLHVYAVTTTSARELSGSPTVLPYTYFANAPDQPNSAIFVRTR
jgi:hypothetical protein